MSVMDRGPKKALLHSSVLRDFSVCLVVEVFFFFPQHNVIESSQALIRCCAGLVAGGD